MEARRVELEQMKRSQRRHAAQSAGISEDDWDGTVESILAAEFRVAGAQRYATRGRRSAPADADAEAGTLNEPLGTTAAPPLPLGWDAQVSRSTGRTYYVNEHTLESTYDYPTGPAAPRTPAVSVDAASTPAAPSGEGRQEVRFALVDTTAARAEVIVTLRAGPSGFGMVILQDAAIKSVVAEGPAARAGIVPNMRITAVESVAVHSREEVIQELQWLGAALPSEDTHGTEPDLEPEPEPEPEPEETDSFSVMRACAANAASHGNSTGRYTYPATTWVEEEYRDSYVEIEEFDHVPHATTVVYEDRERGGVPITVRGAYMYRPCPLTQALHTND